MDDLLTTKQAAELLGYKPNTLDHWRVRKCTWAPPFVRIGVRGVRYSKKALEKYIKERQSVR